jgi:hypothetical protein
MGCARNAQLMIYGRVRQNSSTAITTQSQEEKAKTGGFFDRMNRIHRMDKSPSRIGASRKTVQKKRKRLSRRGGGETLLDSEPIGTFPCIGFAMVPSVFKDFVQSAVRSGCRNKESNCFIHSVSSGFRGFS